MFTKLLFLHVTVLLINYCARGSWLSLEVANLLARHLAFILLLIAFQSLSFCNGELFGNLVNNKILRLFSLVASRHPFPQLPSVLQVDNSSLLKKKGNNFNAHLWIFSALSSVCLRACTFLGVTHVWISPSLTTSSYRLTYRKLDNYKINIFLGRTSKQQFHWRTFAIIPLSQSFDQS